jgi:predicted solute-binding protein
VFAVWAVRSSIPETAKKDLAEMIAKSLESVGGDFVPVAGSHGRRIGLTDKETQDYLAGFDYRLGDREKEAMYLFRKLYLGVETAKPGRES